MLNAFVIKSRQQTSLPWTLFVQNKFSMSFNKPFFVVVVDKMLEGAYTKMLRVVKNVTWQHRITNGVLYAGSPRISTTIRERRLRFSGHCWRSKNEVASDLFLWEPKYGKRSVGGQAHTFVDLLEADTDVPRDCMPAVMDDKVGWRKRAMGGSTEVDLVLVEVVNKPTGLRQYTEFHPNWSLNLQENGHESGFFLVFFYSYNYDLEWRSRSSKLIPNVELRDLYYHTKSEKNQTVNVWIQAHAKAFFIHETTWLWFSLLNIKWMR